MKSSPIKKTSKINAVSENNQKTDEADIFLSPLQLEEASDLHRLFSVLDEESTGKISLAKFIRVLSQMGITEKDQRVNTNKVREKKTLPDVESVVLDFSDFKTIIQDSNGTLIKDAIEGNLIIPDFTGFVKEIKAIFDKAKENTGGHVATYIPQLGRVNPEQFAVSICTIDGQQASFGDHDKYFCIQSISKPINYCIALERLGEEKVHKHVGREPSGVSFNSLSLNNKKLPHNPMINAGAIMTCSLIKPELEMADRFDYVLDTWKNLSGNLPPQFNNSVYLSERQTADRNFALGYFMRENQAFPANTNLIDTLELYFQGCSIEVNTEALAVAASTLANAGICPTTGKRLFNPDTVKNSLSLMYSCGMYDFSGEFAFSIGLPAKSGVGGGLMIVIPNLMGIAVWSPRLDDHGNSVRGIEFCKELVKKFNFHNYDSLINGVSDKIDPRLQKNESHISNVVNLCWAASVGDIQEVRHLIARGVNVNDADYDGRTALHLAASEGHANVVSFLLKHGAAVSPMDRWGNTPLDDAMRSNNQAIIDIIQIYIIRDENNN